MTFGHPKNFKRRVLWLILSFTSALNSFIPTALAAASPPKTAAQAAQTIELTPASWRRLRAGEILVFPRKSDDLGGRAYAFTTEPLWKIFQVITDFPNYPQFFPRSQKAIVLEASKNQLRIHTELAVAGPRAFMWNDSIIRIDHPKSTQVLVTWQAEKTNLRYNYGFWLVNTQKDGTLIVYENHFSLFHIAPALARPHAASTLHDNLQAILKRSSHPHYQTKEGQMDFVWNAADIIPMTAAKETVP